MQYTYENTLLRQVSSNLASGLIKGDPIETRQPVITPITAKISHAQWQQAVAFLLWTQQQFTSEGLVIGYYNQADKTWIIEPPPQITAGMTVKENPALFEAYKNGITSRGYYQLMTVHHHCTSNAFQSGTDAQDEFTQGGTGFHITLGKLDKPVLDLHCRAKLVVPGELTPTGELLSQTTVHTAPFNIVDLIEMQLVLTDAPKQLNDMLIEYSLLTPRHMVLTFPDEWKTRIIKPQTTNYHQGHNYAATTYQPGGMNNWGSGAQFNAISQKQAITHLKSDIIRYPDIGLWSQSNTCRQMPVARDQTIRCYYNGVAQDQSSLVPRNFMMALKKYLVDLMKLLRAQGILTTPILDAMFRGTEASAHPFFRKHFPLFHELHIPKLITQNIYDSAIRTPALGIEAEELGAEAEEQREIINRLNNEGHIELPLRTFPTNETWVNGKRIDWDAPTPALRSAPEDGIFQSYEEYNEYMVQQGRDPHQGYLNHGL